ncbi:MAG: hypothetical protein JKY37_07145 [Nannocystaceae bacterium]|nr:hypothetical protein [Nannocystaceae bacterium]
MFATLDRVYDNAQARAQLRWEPEFDFARVLSQLAEHQPIGSALAREVGVKRYHAQAFEDGPYPTE